MSTASGDTTQDLSLTAPAEDVARAPPTRSGLSLGDLSSVEDCHDDAPTASQSSRHVEQQLQRNLRKQQEHFARQRQLFDDLRGESDVRDDSTAAVAAMSPSGLSSSSRSDNSDLDSNASENGDRGNRCRAEEEQPARQRQEKEFARRDQMQSERELAGIALRRKVSKARTPLAMTERGRAKDAGANSDNDAIRELSRIKAKAISDYERRMAETQQQQSRRLRPATAIASPTTRLPQPRLHPGSAPPRADFVKELSQQEASNEALRKQLELLRRLQVENNRFRHETRVYREQNEVLDEQNQSQRRELKRLRAETADLAAQVEQDQQSLALAAQTSRKLKSCQKQLSAAHTEVETLRVSLQEALELQERSHAKAASDMGNLVTETKRLKRSLKQAKQREARDTEENELLRSTVEALENELSRAKNELHARKRDSGALSAQLAEKSSQCEAIEASATACVQRMETGMEALQKAFDAERERRKKLEAQRSSLQAELETQRSSLQAELETQHCAFQAELETLRGSLDARIEKLDADGKRKQQQIDACERRVAQLQQRLKDKKAALLEQHERYDEHVNELLAKQRQDYKALASLRDECESAEQRHEAERAVALEAKARVGDELRRLRKEAEGLRSYLENSLQNDSSGRHAASAAANAAAEVGSDKESGGGSDAENEAPRTRTSRSERHQALPELQFLQGAVSALRTEAMGFVHAFQRVRHTALQQAKKLAALQTSAEELERLRSEDAAKIADLREQRAVAEQARDITSKEKLEVLRWSQQTCEKNEALEEELCKCEHFVQSLLQRLRRRRRERRGGASEDGEEGGEGDADSGRPASRRRKSGKSERGPPALRDESVSRHFVTLESEVQLVLSAHQSAQQELEQAALERSERASAAQALQQELEAKAQEAERVLAEVETLHAESVREQKKRFDAVASELESEKRELAGELHAANTQRDAALADRARLEAVVARLEADLPVLATVLRLFVLVVQPLVLQVSELQAQKRFLLHENAEYAQSQYQVECIGQVLQELVPMDAGRRLGRSERQRHQRFRRVVIAVFALNRFQRCGALQQLQHPVVGSGETNEAGDSDAPERFDASGGSFGTCTSLKAPRKRGSRASGRSDRRASASSSLQRNPPPTAIKVLAPRSTLAALNLRLVIERLRNGGVAETVADVLALGGPAESAPFLGSVLVQVLAAIDPSATEALLDNTSGAFHCQALLERRRGGSRRRLPAAGEGDAENSESERSAVGRIRQRVLALGKRVEDLHFQRNALQADNYELQTQLEQQAARLQQTEQLLHQTAELQGEVEGLRAQSRRDHETAQQRLELKQRELEAQASETRATQQELRQARVQVESLQIEVASYQEKLRALDTEKQVLHANVAALKLASAEEEEKAEAAKAGASKQEEEVRHLKQAARKAHELYQKANWQLEHEVGERTSLQASVELLTRQKESLERELHDAKLRDVEQSFASDGGSEPAPLRKKAQSRVRFAASDPREDERLHASSEGSSLWSSGDSRKLSPELPLDDACLYHQYTTPSERDSGGATRHERERDDRDGEERRARTVNDALSGVSAPNFRLELSPRSSSDANSKFLDEWRRLQLAAAFDDRDNSDAMRSQHQIDDGAELRGHPLRSTRTEAKAASLQVARAAEIQNNRRRIEVDRVNSAVHDYMDRIDEKLQQMYGIPPSSSASMPPSRSRPSEKRTSRLSDDGDDVIEEEEQEEEGDGSCHQVPTLSRRHGVKADETREVQWFG
ncbi:hypothetical protein PybrP1_008102 [[Pythium] brassicae (nom. inval.)]|nr:hypothetical protein PybrP1_008102 [[Pythium] brassicae (nom. inval.)]